MKLLALITEDWDEIKTALSHARITLGIEIEEVKVKPDLSKENLYTTVSAWAKLLRQDTKSIDPKWIKLLGDFNSSGKYDGYILICDKKKVLSTKSMYGDYTNLDGFHIMEVYATKSTKKQWGLPFTTYNLMHECLHALDYERGAGLKALHDYVDTHDTLDEYIEEIKKKVQITDLLPTVKKRAKALELMMKIWGTPIRITEGYRSNERQDELYAQGRTTPGNIVTNAKAGESFHNYGVAFDVVFREKGYNAPQEDWERLGQFGRILGLSWGGDWKGFVDRPHFQHTKGYGIEQFKKGEVDLSKFN